jgi:hypothetical protein
VQGRGEDVGGETEYGYLFHQDREAGVDQD